MFAFFDEPPEHGHGPGRRKSPPQSSALDHVDDSGGILDL
jgi:hypothetical protein